MTLDRHSSMRAALLASVEAAPDKPAYIYLGDGEGEEARLDFAGLDARAQAVAAALLEVCRPGDRALLVYVSGFEFMCAFWGCLYAGVIAVPTSFPRRWRGSQPGDRTLERLAHIARDAGASIVLTERVIEEATASVGDAARDLRALPWRTTDTLAGAGAAVTPVTLSRERVAFLQYTSGSTSEPKGVAVTHGNLLANAQVISEVMRLHQDAVSVTWLPLFHDMGLIGQALTPLLIGMSAVVLEPTAFLMRPLTWLQAVQHYRAYFTGGPNFGFELAARKVTEAEAAALDLSSWRVAFNGAEPVRPETLRRFAARFAPAGFTIDRFTPCYGLAEATLCVTSQRTWAPPDSVVADARALAAGRLERREPGTPGAVEVALCGPAGPGVELAIVDPITFERLAEGEVGEIWTAGPSVALGYHERPTATAETFGARIADEGDKSYLRTGDLGFVWNGQLGVAGRIKDLIIVDGRNHYPQDLERLAESRHREIRSGCSAAFGIEAAGKERLVLVAEIEPQGLELAELATLATLATLADRLRETIAREGGLSLYAVAFIPPRTIAKTSSGKIRRRATRAAFLEGRLEALHTATFAVDPAAFAVDPAASAVDPAPSAVDPAHAGEAPSSQLAHDDPEEARLARIIAALIAARTGGRAENLDPRSPFTAFGFGSREAVELAGELESRLGRKLGASLLYEHPSIAALSAFLAGQGASPAAALRTSPAAAPRTGPAAALRTGPSAGDSAPGIGGEPVAIIGMACRFPGADGVESYWQLLREGRDAIREVPKDRFDAEALYDEGRRPGTLSTRWGGFLDGVDRFDAAFFGIAPREARAMDPQQRLLLELAIEALDDAGIPAPAIERSATGVFVGLSNNDYARIALGSIDDVDAYSGTGNAYSIAANRLSYLLDLRGPSLAVDTACSASLVAIHLAVQSLRRGECTVAIAGGANVILSPEVTASFTQLNAMARDGRCKAFGAGADGYVRSEGAGVVVLKPLAQALADGDRIQAIVRGSAVNQDGRTNGLTAPSAEAQEAVIRAAAEDAGVEPEQISYVEAHGTGTELGDPIEARALSSALCAHRDPAAPLVIGSVKSNLGHLEAAAGVAGLIKAALAVERGEIPRTLHAEPPSPHLDLTALRLAIANTTRPWPGAERIAGVSSFGFGGTNAHLIVASPPSPPVRAPTSAEPPAEPRLFALSARTSAALRAYAGRLASVVREGTLSLADLASTLALHRTAYEERAAIVATGAEDLAEALGALARGEDHPRIARGRAGGATPQVVLVFPGQGSQWAGMGRELLAESPEFRARFRASARAIAADGGPDVEAALGDAAALSRIDVVQPTLFAIEVALAALLVDHGVRPAAVIGHSMGELAAAVVAGGLSLEDAARVIVRRSRLLAERASDRGAMAVVELSLSEAEEAIAPYGDRLAVAVENGPRSTVISGEDAAVDALVAELTAASGFARRVKVDVASHSPLMDPLLPELEALVREVRPRLPSIPMWSTVLDRQIEAGDLTGAYWSKNLRAPVRFHSAVARLIAEGKTTFVEVSPHPVLTAAISDALPTDAPRARALGVLRRDEAERVRLLHTVGALWTIGAPVALVAPSPPPRPVVPLPPYPWERQRYSIEPSGSSRRRHRGDHPLLGAPARLADERSRVMFSIDTTGDAWRAFSEHQVRGVALLPAAAVLELTLAAARRVGGLTGPMVIEDLRFLAPITVEGESGSELQIFVEGGDGQLLVELAAVGPDGRRTHARGRVRSSGPALGAQEPLGDDDLRAAIARCSQAIDATALYAGLARRGLQYRGAYRRLRDVQAGESTAVGHLERSPGEPLLSAAAVDAGLQLISAAGFERDDGATLLPARIGRAVILAPDAAAAACAMSASVTSRDAAVPRATVRFFDEGGRCVLRLEDVELARPRDAALPPAMRGDLAIAWRKLERPVARAGSRRVVLVGGSPEIAAALAAGGLAIEVMETDAEAVARSRDATLVLAAPLSAVSLAEPGDLGISAERAFHAPLAILSAVARGGATPSRIFVLTRRAEALVSGEAPDPAQALARALASTAAWEIPSVPVTSLDLEGASDLELAGALIAGELLEDRLAIRGREIFAARLEAIDPPAPPLERAENVRVIAERGALDGIRVVPAPRRAPSPGQVEIEVEHAGVNFLDVLGALGARPDVDGPAPLGAECAGRVTSIGAGVEGVRAGDLVMAIAPRAFARFATTDASLAVLVPPGLTSAEAAAVPIAGVTAYLALVELARVQPGETVLVHSGTGGVGLAAIGLLRHLGARILATAGSQTRRALLGELGVELAADSRSLRFQDAVLEHTRGRGVDVVLNSLTGEAMRASVELLAPYGRFVEIAKQELYRDGALRLAPFRQNLAYFALDLARLAEERPQVAGRALSRVRELIAEGALPPPRTETFPIQQAGEALRQLAQARHIGKVTLAVKPALGAGAPRLVRPDRSYLITGGAGAIGLRLLQGLAERGARSVVILSRSEPRADAAAVIAQLTGAGVHVEIIRGDVGEREPVERALHQARSRAPLGGVIHAAGVLDDAMLPEQDAARFDRVAGPKLRGALVLEHALLKDGPPGAMSCDFVAFLSSAAGTVGSPAQAAYAAANAAVDAIALRLAARGVRAVSVAFGPWSEIGLAARAERGGRLAGRGIASIQPDEGVRRFFDAIAAARPSALIMPLDLAALRADGLAARGIWSELLGASEGDEPRPAGSIRAELAALPAPLLEKRVLEHVRQAVAATLQRPGPSLDHEAPLGRMGFDSLLGLELRNRLERTFDLRLSAGLVFNHPSMVAIARHLAQRLSTRPSAEPAPLTTAAGSRDTPEVELTREVAELSDADALALLLGNSRG
ncbi:MAG: SDR family NAD(P)-dependent oxidoreductase [Deltaproteobacteria bacterium]|nr:SDR family NAD(P)-dependent oxidoreductase [Deltaproteobacteria bacterium]